MTPKDGGVTPGERADAPQPRWSETRARQAYLAAMSGRQGSARRSLLVGLAVFLVAASLGAGLLAPRYFAAQRAAAAYCAALRGRDYAAVWALLGADARGGLSQVAYTGAMRALDSAEGAVSMCAASGLAGYTYTPGQTVASDTLTLTRQRTTLRGTLGLALVGGGWRITSVAPSLYGAPLAPVATAAAYCAALLTGDYAADYALLTETMQSVQTQGDYVEAQRLRDTLTGRVTSCAVIGLTSPDSQTLDALLSVTRSTGPRQGGELQIQPDGGAWRISQYDPAIQGVDVGPYLVAQRFCADMAAGDFTGVYALLTPTLQAQTTPIQLAAALTPAPGSRWACGQPQSGSYTEAGAVASWRATLTATGGVSSQRTMTLQFALIEGQWLISGY